MNVQNSQTDTEVDDVFAEEANNAIKETKVDAIEPSQNPSVIEELAKKPWRARAEWKNTSMTERTPLPKIIVNRKAELLIKQTTSPPGRLATSKLATNSHVFLLCIFFSCANYKLKSEIVASKWHRLFTKGKIASPKSI